MFKRNLWVLAEGFGRIALLVVLAVCLALNPVRSQNKTPKQKSEDDEIIKVNSNLVNLDVIIKDKKGKVVRDLKAEDFIVTENGVKQNIEFSMPLSWGALRPKIPQQPQPRQS